MLWYAFGPSTHRAFVRKPAHHRKRCPASDHPHDPRSLESKWEVCKRQRPELSQAEGQVQACEAQLHNFHANFHKCYALNSQFLRLQPKEHKAPRDSDIPDAEVPDQPHKNDLGWTTHVRDEIREEGMNQFSCFCFHKNKIQPICLFNF